MILPMAVHTAAATGPCDTYAATSVSGAGQTLYVQMRGTAPASPQPTNVWIYEETNHIDGLQRGGTSTLNSTDHCVDDPNVAPDTAIY